MSEPIPTPVPTVPPSPPPTAGGSSPWRQVGPALAILATVVAAAVLLRSQGRLWWCACGRPNLWSGDAWGPHNSQHLFDPYSFTHVLHGLVFCGLFACSCPRLRPAWQLWLTVALESLWEVAENSAAVIERYRAATAGAA